MNSPQLKYAACVFAGGASYGAMATVVKVAFGEGFVWQQTVMSQALFGVALFAIGFFVEAARNKGARRISPLGAARLLGTGMVTCLTGVLYSISLTMLPVAVAITLLFQFTWIGIVIQVVATRKPPTFAQVVAAGVVLAGTVLAGGMLEGGALAAYDPLGLACALGSAVSCATFMFLSGRVETDMPGMQRGLLVCLGSFVLGLIVCPDYFASGVLFDGIAPFGLALGMFALFFPVILFGIGAPHLPTGIATIMASAELPAGVAISTFVLGEPVSVLQVVGVAVILCGVVVAQAPDLASIARHRKQQKRP